MAASFRAFRREPADVRALAAAFAAGATLHRSVNASGYQKPLHDELALQLGLGTSAGVRRYWTPTTGLLRDMGKLPMLQVADPFVSAETLQSWQGLKLEELASQVVRVVTGVSASIRRGVEASASRWVHQLLRFAGAAEPEAADRERQHAEPVE